MNMLEVMNVVLNFCALLINVILLIGVLLGGNLKKPVFRWLFLSILFNLIGLSSEAAVSLFYDVPGALSRFLCRMFDYISYASLGPCVVAFGGYLYEYLSLKTKLSRKIFHLIIIYGGVAVILATIAQLNGMYGMYDEHNRYHQQDTFWISQILPTIFFITCLIVTLRYIKVLKPREWFSLLLYPFAPIACFAVETTYPELWIAYVGSAFTMLLMYVSLYVELRQQNVQQEMELQNARIAVMLSQIKPHFLYNSLGSIQDLCHRDASEAELAVRDFAKYLRRNLDSLSLKEPIPFSQELEHVKLYLSLEKKRFGDHLNVIYDIEAESFHLPALTLQTLVENAVTHGITQRVEGGTLIIRTKAEPDGFHVTVEDDGVGFSDSHHAAESSHTGIENTRRRLELCGGSLVVQSTPDIGTVAVITIPRGGSHEYTGRRR